MTTESSKWAKGQDATREVVAIAIWLFIFLKLMVFDVDFYLVERFAPSWRSILEFKFFVLAPAAAVLLLLVRGPKARNAALYVAFYPIIVLFWKIPKFLFRNWPLAITFAPAVHEIVQSFRFTFAIYAFAALSGLIAIKSHNPWLLKAAMAFLFVFLAAHLLGSAKKAYRSSVFSGLAEMVREFRIKMTAHTNGIDLWKKVVIDPAKKETQTDYEHQLSLFYIFNWSFEIVAEKLHKIASSRRMDLYLLLCWLWTFFVTAMVYALEYLCLSKVIQGAFSSTDTGFWGFFGFSLGKLLPSSVSTLTPIAPPAIFLCYSQLVCGLVVLIILFFTFLTVARERYREDIDAFIRELRLTAEEGEKQFVAAYALPLIEVELILLAKQASFINKMREFRGLPELKPPSTPEGPPAS